MSDSNFYEEVARRATTRINAIVEKATPIVMGGKNPPGRRELTGKQLLDFYRDAPVEQKQQLWGSLSPEEQQMIRDGYQTGAG